MFVHTVKLLPVRHRRVGVFFAPDPVHGNLDAEFNLETYRMLARGTQIVRAGAFGGSGQDRYAIKSEFDGEPRMLPAALSTMWRDGEVPAEALPEMLFRLGPEFSRPRDFEPLLPRKKWRRRFGWFALVTGVVLVLALLPFFFDGGGAELFSRRGRVITLTVAQWLARPMQPHVYVSTAGPVQALATVPLDGAGYTPPDGRFDVPTAGSSRPGYTLARIQAADEQRLVLVSAYERSLLPRVFLSGAVIPTADLALPAAELGRAGAGAQKLNSALVLCNHVQPRRGAGAGEFLIVSWVVLLMLAIFLPVLTIVLAVIWRRQEKRHRQLDTLRQRLGLPDPAVARPAPSALA